MRKKSKRLRIEQTLPFVISDVVPSSIRTIWLVGVGGTGSLIAASLARMLYHLSRQGATNPPRVLLIDGDIVEERNIGRQNFSPWDVGYSKAEIIAARYNSALSTGLEAIHAYFSSDLGRELSEYHAPGHTLLMSAVDNNRTRREIASFVVKERRYGYGRDILWADVGNEEFTGQLVVGNTMDPADIERTLQSFQKKGSKLVKHLPNVLLVHPEMSDPDEDQKGDGPAPPSCAVAIAEDRQSLIINDMAARVAVNAIYSLLRFASLNYFAVFFNSRDNFALPLYNTRANFQRILSGAPQLRPLNARLAVRV